MKKAIALLSAALFAAVSGAADQLLYDAAALAAGKCAVRSLYSGKGFKVERESGKIADRECAVFRVSEQEPVAEKDRWAAFGCSFEPSEVQPVGLRWELAVPKEITIVIEIKHLTDLNKGFWTGYRLGGTKKVTLKPGVQTLDVRWSDFGIRGEKAAEANGAVLCLMSPGELGVISFSLILPDEDGSQK